MERIELVLGVTGHRDPTPMSADWARVRVRELFRQLRELLPDTPFRLVSGMADGADRLVAMEALEEGIPVEAVLPMPMPQYRADFSTRSLTELENLLKRPEVQPAELDVPPDVTLQDIEEPGPARDESYNRLTEELRRRCRILIVLWDGEDNGLKGGTSETMKRFLMGEPGAEGEGSRGSPHRRHAYWIPVGRFSRDDQRTRTTAGFLTGATEPPFFVCHEHMPVELRHELLDLNESNRRQAEAGESE